MLVILSNVLPHIGECTPVVSSVDSPSAFQHPIRTLSPGVSQSAPPPGLGLAVPPYRSSSHKS